MTSFDNIIMPICGKWFETKPLENESDDRAGNTVSSVCVTNGKDTERYLIDICHFTVVP